MKVSEAMTREVRVANPEETTQNVARLMAELDVGVLPVGEKDRLVGMITDRDIAVRGVAQGKTRVRDVMTAEVKYCFDDQDVDEVAMSMGNLQVRRLPVLNRDKRLVGILSLGDIANREEEEAGEALSEISRPGGQHSQSR